MSRRKRQVRKTPQPNSRPRNFADSFVLRYTELEIHETALKHGISELDIHHATDQVVQIFEYLDEWDRPRILMIGPDRSGNLLELIATIYSDQTMRIFHAMKLRPKFEVLTTERKDE